MSKQQVVLVKNISKGSAGLSGTAGFPMIQLSPGGSHEFAGDALQAYSRSIDVLKEMGVISVDGKEAKPSPKDLDNSLIKEEAKAQSIINEPAKEEVVEEEVAAEEEVADKKSAKKAKK